MMIKHHNYSLSDIENIYPFERDIYALLLTEELKKKAQG